MAGEKKDATAALSSVAKPNLLGNEGGAGSATKETPAEEESENCTATALPPLPLAQPDMEPTEPDEGLEEKSLAAAEAESGAVLLPLPAARTEKAREEIKSSGLEADKDQDGVKTPQQPRNRKKATAVNEERAKKSTSSPNARGKKRRADSVALDEQKQPARRKKVANSIDVTTKKDAWREKFAQLQSFRETNGHTNVARSFTNKSLAIWVDRVSIVGMI